MRLVLDTNVLVSALWKPGSVPALALDAVWATAAVVLYDARILEEYRAVLARPKFRAIDPATSAALIDRIAACGTALENVARWEGALPDHDDRTFVEVARAGAADAVITGNVRDFPEGLGFAVWPPAMLLAQLG
jgi:putative PIN family toxin of toxin-antitoxin system